MASYSSVVASRTPRSRFRQYPPTELKARRGLSPMYVQLAPNDRKDSAKKFYVKLPKIQHSQESKIKEIRHYVQTQQWARLIPYVDELIHQIDRGTVSISFIPKLLDSVVQAYEAMEKNTFTHEIIQILTALIKDILVFVMQGNTTDAIHNAKHIKEVLLVTLEASHIASEEGLSPLPMSQIVQIDTINGRPIYAVK